MTNRLYYGDNLEILRKEIKDESVDLIYLDPPFNSKRDYNLLFKTPKGQESDAQITAFEDSWHWGPQAEREFFELQAQPNTDVAQMMQALRDFLGTNDMMAYLTMMANRLLEMQRVLKPTGSLYLHCDPTASHYLKIVLDGVFSPEHFLSEIIWKRTSAHSSAKRWGPVHDTLLLYSKGNDYTWNQIYQPYEQEYIDTFFDMHDPDGRHWKRSDLTGAGTRNGETGLPWRGIDVTAKGRHWANPPSELDKLDAAGRVHWPKKGDGMPRLKQYPEDLPGVPFQDVIMDVRPMHNLSDERLGYPTQKPLALLERIIQASSNVGDVVLDPFCGCGTAVHAAQKLNRKWMGIDITHLAISLIEKRMKKAFPYLEAVAPKSKKAMQAGPNAFEVIGVPHDVDAARDLAARDKHQFQLWAVSLVGAQPYRGGVKGSDKGVDGLIFPEVGKAKTEKVVVSVKGGENVGAAMVRDLKGVLEREKAVIGLFVTLALPTKEMIKEAASAGMYESPHHGAFPKLQILTIEGLLSGKERAQYPDMAYGAQTFKHAKTENQKTDQQKLF
jgi:site-specific DNA-methyltransferase (adenine-specific)